MEMIVPTANDPQANADTQLTPEQKKQRQRMHVRRSYYRMLDKMRAMRDEVRQLTQQYLLAINSKEAQLSTHGMRIITPTHHRAVTLYMQIARAKEALLAENAALQRMLEDSETLSYRVSQLVLEVNEEISFSITPPDTFRKFKSTDSLLDDDDKRLSVVHKVTPTECREINSETYVEIQRFFHSNSYLTTGATDAKSRASAQLGDRHEPRQHRSLHSASLNAQLFRAQRVDGRNVVIYRVFFSESGKYAAKSLFLVLRFEIGNGGFVVLLRSIDKDRLRRNQDHEELFDDQSDVAVEQEQWIDVFSWLIFDQVGDTCKLGFGGGVRSTSVASSTLWMLEVLLIALRWEAKVNGPIFSLPTS